VHLLLKEYMNRVQKRKSLFTSEAQCLLSVVTAPLLTLSASLQMSIPANAVTISDFRKEKEESLKNKILETRMFKVRNKGEIIKTQK